MHSPGINGEGELRGQPANPGSPGKMAFKTECVCAFSMAVTILSRVSMPMHAERDIVMANLLVCVILWW